MKRILLLLLSLLAWTAHAGAATYYIATDGNDSYNALQAQDISTPWATPSAAAAKIHTAGVTPSTVYIRGGSYTDTYTFLELGGITWTAYPGETPVITHTGTDNIFWLMEGDNQVISKLTLQRNTATEGSIITITGTNEIIEDNIFNSSGAAGGTCIKGNAPATGIGGQGNSAIIRRNILSGCPNQGIELVHNDDVLIEKNILSGCSDCIVLKGGSANPIARENICYNPVYVGVLIGGDTGASFNEHAYETTGALAENNIILYTTNENNGIRFQGAINSEAYNNTTVGGSLRIMSSTTVVNPSANNKIYNNIFYGAGDDGVAKVDTNNTTGEDFKNNAYYCTDGCAFLFGWAGDYPATYETWLTNSGETGSIYTDPLLDAQGRPKENSLVLEAGTWTGTGQKYTRSLPDIGAYGRTRGSSFPGKLVFSSFGGPVWGGLYTYTLAVTVGGESVTFGGEAATW